VTVVFLSLTLYFVVTPPSNPRIVGAAIQIFVD